jgi:hypothetical protein
VDRSAVYVVRREASDDEVVAALRGRSSELLVIPFRQPGVVGRRENGVDLLQRLERELPDTMRLPVLMPSTVFAAGQVRLMLGDSNPDESLSTRTRHRILSLLEDELADPKSADLLRMHLQLYSAPAGGARFHPPPDPHP